MDAEAPWERAAQNGLDAVADVGREVWKLKTVEDMRELRRVTEEMIAKLVVASSVLKTFIDHQSEHVE